MKLLSLLFLMLAFWVSPTQAATIHWAASANHGINVASGSPVPDGSLARLGWFRDPATGLQLTDAQIRALSADPVVLDDYFIEAHSTLTTSGHFSATAVTDPTTIGLSLEGKQIFVWVLNADELSSATEQGIFYWSLTDRTTNPDATLVRPGARWAFPVGTKETSVEITDLTTGQDSVSAGARVVLGSFPSGLSPVTQSPNFSLESINQTLAIATPTRLPGAVRNRPYSFSFKATGDTTNLSWILSAGAVTGISFSESTGTLEGTPTELGNTTFTIAATNGIDTVSRDFNFTVAEEALSITDAPLLPVAHAGTPYLLDFTVLGGTPPYTWSQSGGLLPAGMTISQSGSLSGTASEIGLKTFRVRVADAGGLAVSKSFTLTTNAAPFVMQEAVAGAIINTPYYFKLSLPDDAPAAWSVDFGNLPPGITLGADGILSGTTSATGDFSFVAKAVAAGSGIVVTKQYNLQVTNAAVQPGVFAPRLPVLSVSAAGFSYTLTATPFPSTFTVKGLPPGLKLNGRTGEISGRPTTAGIYQLRIRAINAAGISEEVTAQMIIQPIETGALGVFVGSVEPNAVVNAGLGGRLDLMTSVNGSYTLKLNHAGKPVTFKGVMEVPSDRIPRIRAVNTKLGLDVDLSLDHETETMMGMLTVAGTTAAISGWKNPWNAKTNPASKQAGYYTVGLDLAASATDPELPQGSGFASFTIGLDGRATIKGRTADGTSFATPGFVGSAGQLLVYQPLYKKKAGVIMCNLQLALDFFSNFIDNKINGTGHWERPAIPGRLYPNGFTDVSLEINGQLLSSSTAAGNKVLGLPSHSGDHNLVFTDGGLGAQDPSATFTYPSTLKPLVATNSSLTKLSINAATGAVTGSFTLDDAGVKRKVTYQGLIIRNSTSPRLLARGYFLLPQLLPNLRSSLQLSGKVAIESP